MIPFDPKKTIVLCYEYGGFDESGRSRRLVLLSSSLRWISETFPAENVYSVNVEPYLVARNRVIRDTVLPVAAARSLEWLLSIDNDVTATRPGVDLFLHTPGDVVACVCPMPSPHAWDEPTAFHTPLWRCRIDVLQAVQPPWFDFIYSEDRCRLVACDCQFFAAKCRAAGFEVSHGGNCGHGNYGAAWWPACHGALPVDPMTGGTPPGAVTRQLLHEGRLI